MRVCVRMAWGGGRVPAGAMRVCHGGGRLQPVLMRPTPQLSFKTWGGGAGGGRIQGPGPPPPPWGVCGAGRACGPVCRGGVALCCALYPSSLVIEQASTTTVRLHSSKHSIPCRHVSRYTPRLHGGVGFQLGGSGGDAALWLDPPLKRAQLAPPPPQILPRLTPGPGGDLDPKFGKMKMGVLESARRGGSENSSFAMYLVKWPSSMLKKIFSARVHKND